jgi:PTH1 family peptidyl-tRNA hydrolase
VKPREWKTHRRYVASRPFCFARTNRLTAASTAAGGDRVVLAKPTTLMNRSGQAVVRIRDFYKAEPVQMLVICDDFNLDLGTLRLRGKGSHGGQNGLRDIIAKIGTEEFPRLRCGIGPVFENQDVVKYVLEPFRRVERRDVDDMVERACMAALTWVDDGEEAAQQRFNGAG